MTTESKTLASVPGHEGDTAIAMNTVTMDIATDLSTPIPVDAFVPHQVAMVLWTKGKDTLRRARLEDKLLGSIKTGGSWHYPVSSLVAAGLLGADRLASAQHFVDARQAAVTIREQADTIREQDERIKNTCTPVSFMAIPSSGVRSQEDRGSV